jgi:hypothetical protein
VKRPSPAGEAAAWRQASEDSGIGVFDLWSAVRQRGWRAEITTLRAAEGGIEACTVPSSDHGFHFMVDDRMAGHPESGSGEQSPLATFRLAHEVGHTLFYRQGSPPSRSLPPTPEEERFCDAFALALLRK